MEQQYMLQCLIGRAEQIAALEAVADLGLEKDERLPDFEAAINMVNGDETEKQKFQMKHVCTLFFITGVKVQQGQSTAFQIRTPRV